MMCGGLSNGAVEMPFKAGSSAKDILIRSETALGGTNIGNGARCAPQTSSVMLEAAAFFAVSEAALSSFCATAATAPSRLASARACASAVRWTHIAALAENPCPRNKAQIIKKVSKRGM